MIKKIIIVPYVQTGRLSRVGKDGHTPFKPGFNPLKPKHSTTLKANLEQALGEAGLAATIDVDVNQGNLQALKREGYDLMLLPYEVAMYEDYTDLDAASYYKMKPETYEAGKVDGIMRHIKRMAQMGA